MSHSFEIHDVLAPSDTFVHRHLGPSDGAVRDMLDTLGLDSLDALVDDTIPATLRLDKPLDLGPPRGEHELVESLRAIAEQNEVYRSLIGMGYYDTITPPIIQRNILENPGWYTQYTPYQAEISQGRLEALINFQTMVSDLTGLPLSNASLLDEATAAAEAMTMCHRVARGKKNAFFMADHCHPQTLSVVAGRAEPMGIELRTGNPDDIDFGRGDLCGVLIQCPTTDGRLYDYAALVDQAHATGALVVVATDLLALTLVKPPGEMGADIAVGNSQRFGVPLGYGGPHAAFMATSEKHARQMPGRLVGVSKDAQGKPAFRLAIQTREQHIRREKATSNICTAQVLLAIMSGMYAVYHGPQGLRRIAQRVYSLTAVLAAGLRRLGVDVADVAAFDTIRADVGRTASDVLECARDHRINLRDFGDGTIGISLDERTTPDEVQTLWQVFADGKAMPFKVEDIAKDVGVELPAELARTSEYMAHDVFNRYHAEHEMLRYLHRLQSRDLSLCQSMIPLGSCTMKLNASSEMLPITWPEFASIHPFAPPEQTRGYDALFKSLCQWLGTITGFPAVSLQPNSGAAGEYTGLRVIRACLASRDQGHRDVCLIPVSAHGTNPASAIMAGCTVVAVECNDAGDICIEDLKAKAEKHRDRLAAIMITYPSTHGVFEAGVREICQIVHDNGGLVYMDGANMNAQVGLLCPADLGADVVHLNLHKTFCIPHGGGGPGMGPIACTNELAPFLPGHPVINTGGASAIKPVSAAPFGSPSILPISWMYIGLMGEPGLKKATQVAILSANYMATRLKEHYPVLFSGKNGRVAHEFILDCRAFKKSAGVEVEDIAKRLMDYGFHAPTMSWPVAGTLMIEPTESESKDECDRLCDALIAIRDEIRAIEDGRIAADDSPLKHAPHTAAAVSSTEWARPYPREQGAYPAAWLREYKFWPPVARIDNVYGDRNLFCTCPTVEDASA